MTITYSSILFNKIKGILPRSRKINIRRIGKLIIVPQSVRQVDAYEELSLM